ncbi:LacI family DNA-binding transcriptional regulator [Variovorax sp. PCZ-1]|uniref:LacI family DNA-binding transcriptional regulator n=1 Tax=Variovorax sp. PCZ-1 TaxID=2835533 RepID=UPI001BCD7D68|nr:LacI family DNA-binding transcriptional regulator [Variovorax sp. PCZ-1]MBS7808883.1 LacI family DNA-binding transcriptional regulator [Variovorax sp. PCZ-1]
MTTPITITQIAEEAGVGTATVDRVLNNRPGVNPATVERVQAAMQKLGASTPSRGRPRVSANYRFAFVLPAVKRGVFDLVDRVIAQAAGEFRHQHITEVTHRLPAEDPAVFASQLASMTDFDGIAVLAPDVPAVKLAINELVRAGVHVVTLFSDVPGSMRETYIGADNRAAGRTAGTLLGHSLPQHQPSCCLLVSPATRYAAEIDRSIGFLHLLEERFAQVLPIQITDIPEKEEDIFELTRDAIRNLNQAAPLGAVHIVSVGSAAIVRALDSMGYGTSVRVAGHDLIEPHRNLLVSGGLTYVLHQDVQYSVLAAGRVLRSLCDGVRGALSVGHPRVEIATVENLA